MAHGRWSWVRAAAATLATTAAVALALPSAASARSCSFRFTGAFPTVLHVHAYRTTCGWARAIGHEEQSFWASHGRTPRFWGRWRFAYRQVTQGDAVVMHLVARRGRARVTMDLAS